MKNPKINVISGFAGGSRIGFPAATIKQNEY
jgi:hypothetical protein